MKTISNRIMAFAIAFVCCATWSLYQSYQFVMDENEEALAVKPKNCNLDCDRYVCGEGYTGPGCVCGLDYGK